MRGPTPRIFGRPDPEVNAAIIRLSDALCTYERSTGRESVLILREQGGFAYRAVDLPKRARGWIARFDKRQPVEPFTFSLRVTV